MENQKQILAGDFGYGFDKATDGVHTCNFPSVVGDALQADFENDIVRANLGHVIALNGQEWFYGDHAQKHSRNPQTLFGRERVEQRDLMELLFCAAMTELDVEGRVHLCTGLPVDWFEDKETLEKMLLGEHRFAVDGEPRDVFVCQVVVVPQPFGSFYDRVLDSDGKAINPAFIRGKVGVLDAGTFTTDFALSDGLEYVVKGSGSITVAMSTVWRQVGDAIKATWGIEYKPHEVDRILRNGATIVYKGHERSVEPFLQPAVDAMAQQVIAEAREKWGKALDFKAILLTGGGASYIKDHVQAVYDQCRVVPDPQMGNLRGFYKYALRKFGK